MEKKCTLCGDIINIFDGWYEASKLDIHLFKPINREGFICMKCYDNSSEEEKSEWCFGKAAIVPPGLSNEEIADFIAENISPSRNK